MTPKETATKMHDSGWCQWTVICVVSEKTLRLMFSVSLLRELLASPRLLQLLMAQFCSSELGASVVLPKPLSSVTY